jgi:DNA-binding MarR family transcriptional regulator
MLSVWQGYPSTLSSKDHRMPETKRQPRTMYLVWRASEAISNLAERHRGDGVLALSKYVVLTFLRDRDDLTGADVARRMSYSPQSANETISSLEKAGLLTKQTRPSNRKAKFLVITELGLDALDQTERAMDLVEQEAFGNLGETGLPALRAALLNIIETTRAATKAADS